MIKHLDTVEQCIGHINIPVVIHRQAGSVVGISNFDFPPETSSDIHDLNPMVPRIEYDELAPCCCQLRWILKLPRSRPATALAKAVKDMTLLVEHDNHVAGRVANVDVLRCRVHRYTPWSFEVGFAPFGFFQIATELAFRIENQDRSRAAIRYINVALTICSDANRPEKAITAAFETGILRMNEVENVYGLGTDVRYENTMCRVGRHSVWCLQNVDGPPILLGTRDDIQSPIHNGVRSLDILGRRELADKTQVFRRSFSVAVHR